MAASITLQVNAFCIHEGVIGTPFLGQFEC